MINIEHFYSVDRIFKFLRLHFEYGPYLLYYRIDICVFGLLDIVLIAISFIRTFIFIMGGEVIIGLSIFIKSRNTIVKEHSDSSRSTSCDTVGAVLT